MKKKAAKKKTARQPEDVSIIDVKQTLNQHACDLARFISEEIPILGFNVRRLFNDDIELGSEQDEERKMLMRKLTTITSFSKELFGKQLSETKKLWLFAKQRSGSDPTTCIVNAEFELRQFLDELLNIHAKPQTRPKRGRPKSDRVKERQRIVAVNHSMKPEKLQDLIQKETGTRPTIDEVRNDKKRVKKKPK